MAESRGIQSIEVGHRLLRVLREGPGPTSLKELAQRAKMSPTKAHYYLTSFVRVGLVSQTGPGGHYDLGPEALRLGLAALSHLDILGIAREAMFDVRDATGEAVFLSVWGNRGPTIVHRVEGFHLSPLSIRVGSVLDPLSATGRAILSTFGDAVLRDIIAGVFSEAAPNDPWYGTTVDDAIALIEEVRRDGIARGRRTVAAESGFVGLAAPIHTFEGSAQAALTINGNAQTLDMKQSGPNVKALLVATSRIANLTGGQADPAGSKRAKKADTCR